MHIELTVNVFITLYFCLQLAHLKAKSKPVELCEVLLITYTSKQIAKCIINQNFSRLNIVI